MLDRWRILKDSEHGVVRIDGRDIGDWERNEPDEVVRPAELIDLLRANLEPNGEICLEAIEAVEFLEREFGLTDEAGG